MAVVVDAVGTPGGTTTSTTVTSFNYTGITVGSGSDRALVFVCAINGPNFGDWPSSLTATWDNGASNQAMTLIATGTDPGGFGDSVYIFGLLNPTAGNKTLRVAWTSKSCNIWCNAVAFTGVDQTSNAAAFQSATGSGNDSSPANLSIASSADSYCVAGYRSGEGFAGTGTGSRLFDHAIDGGTLPNTNAHARYGVGASPNGSLAADFSFAFGLNWGGAIVNVSPSAGGGGSTQALSAKSIAVTFGKITFSGNAGISGKAASQAKAVSGFGGMASIAARAAAQSRARASILAKANMMGRSSGTSRAGATVGARAWIAAIGRAASSIRGVTSAFIGLAVSSRSFGASWGRAGISSRASISARGGAMSSAKGATSSAAQLAAAGMAKAMSWAKGGMSARANLTGQSMSAGKAGSSFSGRISLAAKATAASFGRILKPGSIALIASSFARAAMGATFSGAASLSARSTAQATARPQFKATAFFVAATRSMASAKSGVITGVVLAARSAGRAFARGQVKATTQLAAASRGMVKTRSDIIARVQLAARATGMAQGVASLQGVAPMLAITARSLAALTMRGALKVFQPSRRVASAKGGSHTATAAGKARSAQAKP